MSRLLRTMYRLRYHTFADWALDRWLMTLAFGAGLLIWLAGRRDPGWTAALESGVLALIGLIILFLRNWAAGRMYVDFKPQPSSSPPPPGAALDPNDKIALHVTGVFEVEGKQHFFAGLLAYWRTFATREHSIMAIQHPSRYLLLGSIPARDTGMWYIFFAPSLLSGITPGELSWDGLRRPALQVCYAIPLAIDPPAWRRILQLPVQTSERRLLYLVFDDRPAQLRVWADLLADASLPIKTTAA